MSSFPRRNRSPSCLPHNQFRRVAGWGALIFVLGLQLVWNADAARGDGPSALLEALQSTLTQKIRGLRPAYVGIFEVLTSEMGSSQLDPLSDWRSGISGALLPIKFGGGTIIDIDEKQRLITILTHSDLAVTDSLKSSRQCSFIVQTSVSPRPLVSRWKASDPIIGLAVLEAEIPLDWDLARLQSVDVNLARNLEAGAMLLLLSDPISMAKQGSASSRLTTVKRLGTDVRNLNQPAGDYPTDFSEAWIDGLPEPGLIGGPLFDLAGRFVGICRDADDSAVTGRGLPVILFAESTIGTLLDLKRGLEVEHGRLPFRTETVNPALLEVMMKDLPSDRPRLQGGVRIVSSLQEEPGLDQPQAGDVILGVNNQTVSTASELHSKLLLLPPGEEVALQFWNPQSHTLDESFLCLVKLAAPRDSHPVGTASRYSSTRGITVGFPVPPFSVDGTSAPRYQRGVQILEVESGSPAALAGLKVGECILQVGEREVNSPAEFHDALEGWTGGTPLTIFGRPTEVIVAAP